MGHAWQGDRRPWKKTKTEILDTHEECLNAVLGKHIRWGPF
jgi:hypothetical protein